MARLLVVDDEEKIRLIIRKYAEMEGHQVTMEQSRTDYGSNRLVNHNGTLECER